MGKKQSKKNSDLIKSGLEEAIDDNQDGDWSSIDSDTEAEERPEPRKVSRKRTVTTSREQKRRDDRPDATVEDNDPSTTAVARRTGSAKANQQTPEEPGEKQKGGVVQTGFTYSLHPVQNGHGRAPKAEMPGRWSLHLPKDQTLRPRATLNMNSGIKIKMHEGFQGMISNSGYPMTVDLRTCVLSQMNPLEFKEIQFTIQNSSGDSYALKAGKLIGYMIIVPIPKEPIWNEPVFKMPIMPVYKTRFEGQVSNNPATIKLVGSFTEKSPKSQANKKPDYEIHIYGEEARLKRFGGRDSDNKIMEYFVDRPVKFYTLEADMLVRNALKVSKCVIIKTKDVITISIDELAAVHERWLIQAMPETIDFLHFITTGSGLGLARQFREGLWKTMAAQLDDHDCPSAEYSRLCSIDREVKLRRWAGYIAGSKAKTLIKLWDEEADLTCNNMHKLTSYLRAHGDTAVILTRPPDNYVAELWRLFYEGTQSQFQGLLWDRRREECRSRLKELEDVVTIFGKEELKPERFVEDCKEDYEWYRAGKECSSTPVKREFKTHLVRLGDNAKPTAVVMAKSKVLTDPYDSLLDWDDNDMPLARIDEEDEEESEGNEGELPKLTEEEVKILRTASTLPYYELTEAGKRILNEANEADLTPRINAGVIGKPVKRTYATAVKGPTATSMSESRTFSFIVRREAEPAPVNGKGCSLHSSPIVSSVGEVEIYTISEDEEGNKEEIMEVINSYNKQQMRLTIPPIEPKEAVKNRIQLWDENDYYPVCYGIMQFWTPFRRLLYFKDPTRFWNEVNRPQATKMREQIESMLKQPTQPAGSLLFGMEQLTRHCQMTLMHGHDPDNIDYLYMRTVVVEMLEKVSDLRKKNMDNLVFWENTAEDYEDLSLIEMLLEGQEQTAGKAFEDTALMLGVYKYCVSWEAMLMDYKLPEEVIQISMTMTSLLLMSRLMKLRNDINLSVLMQVQILRLEIKVTKVAMWMSVSYPNPHGILPWLTALEISLNQSTVDKLTKLGERMKVFRNRGRYVQEEIEEGRFLKADEEASFIKEGLYLRANLDKLVRGILSEHHMSLMEKIRKTLP